MIVFSNGIKLSIVDSKVIVSDADSVHVELFADEAYECLMMVKHIVDSINNKKDKNSLQAKTSSGVSIMIDRSQTSVNLVIGGIVLTLSIGQFLSFHYYLNRLIMKLTDQEEVKKQEGVKKVEETGYKSKIDIDFNSNDINSEQNGTNTNKEEENEEVSQNIQEFRDLVLSFLALQEDGVSQEEAEQFQKITNKLLNKNFVSSMKLLNMYISTFKNMVNSKDVLNENVYLKQSLHFEFPILESLYSSIQRASSASEKIIMISLYWLLSEYIQVNNSMALIEDV